MANDDHSLQSLRIKDTQQTSKMPPPTTTITSLPDELLLQILSHNVPDRLTTRLDFTTYMRLHAISKRFLRLARDAFFHTFTHEINLTFTVANLTRHKTYTQVHVHDSPLMSKKSFTEQVRRVAVRLNVYYPESLGVAMEELRGVLGRYGRLGWVGVTVETTSWRVAEQVRGLVEGVLEEEMRSRGRGRVMRRVEVLLMGERVVEGGYR